MIRNHLYVKSSNTAVFPIPAESSLPSRLLSKGNWVGVVEKVGEWVRVVGVYFTGWIKADQLESRPPFDLHIEQDASKPVAYINSIA